MIVLFMGPQGSGKGTVAEAMEADGWVHVSAGDVLREEVDSGSELGKELKAIMDKGGLIADGHVLQLLKPRLSVPEGKKGILLDGFPRNKEQADRLNKEFDVDCVMILDISDELAVKRISGRTQCRTCGEIYGTSKPPQQEGVCDKDGGELYMRDDDKPDAVKKRLEIYHTQTAPLVELYADKVLKIDGTPSIDQVVADVKDALTKCQQTA